MRSCTGLSRADRDAINVIGWSGVDRTEFPAVDAWLRRLLKRPGFEKGRHVPTPHKHLDYDDVPDEEINKMAASTRAWVQTSMKEEAK